MESGGGRWCSDADEVVVAVGRYVRKCEAGEGAGAKNPKSSPSGSVLGSWPLINFYLFIFLSYSLAEPYWFSNSVL